jgi:hypothetical protein
MVAGRFPKISINRIQVNCIGMISRRDRLPEPALREIEKAERLTAAGRRLHLPSPSIIHQAMPLRVQPFARAAALPDQRPPSVDLLKDLLTERLTAENWNGGSAYSHRWRKASFGLPTLGVRLPGTSFYRPDVARLRRNRPGYCDRRIPSQGAAWRCTNTLAQ